MSLTRAATGSGLRLKQGCPPHLRQRGCPTVVKLAHSMADSSHKDGIITRVPSELLIQIIDNLVEPGDVLRLGRTCKALQTITSSDDVWRCRVERLVNAHRRQEQKHCQQEWKATADLGADESVYRRHVQRVLGKGARYLGELARPACTCTGHRMVQAS